jgi:hypothetical protein
MQSSTTTYTDQARCDFDNCTAKVRARLLYDGYEIRMCGRHLRVWAHSH